MRQALRPLAPWLVPELRLWLLPPDSPLWHASSPEAHGWPYWAFAWPGGQALARYLLDHPATARGRRVLAFGAGGGVEAVAAMRAGALQALCADLDPTACEVAQDNAALAGVALATTTLDLVGSSPEAELMLVGDACYEPALAARVGPWLRAQAARGLEVLVGDPGRVPLALPGEVLATYPAPFDGDPRGGQLWPTTVTRVARDELQGLDSLGFRGARLDGARSC
jgi:predicted nicotinamide N-methyase